MQALTLENQLRLRNDYDTPSCPEGEALIRPTLVGVCKTDLELVKGYMGFQGVLGHEFIGVVEQCAQQEWVGARVVGEINCAPPNVECADPRHLDGRTVLGILGRDGVMAQLFTLPIQNLLRVPDHLSDDKAVFTEPLAAAYQIVEQVDPLPDRALVLGDGRLGSLCALALAERGCVVTLVGKHPAKLTPLKPFVETQLVGDAQLAGFELVVEATGSEGGLQQALDAVAPKGTVILKTTVAAPHSLNLASIVINEIQVLGSRCGRFAPALQALASGRVDPTFLIEKTYPLSEALQAFEHASRPGTRKILLEV